MLALLLMAATGAVAQTTYSVVGSNSAMFGSAWDASSTANDMTKNGDGTYSITYTNVNFTDTEEVQYKVVKDHSWDEAYPNDNRVINIAKAGTYTVTIHFNPTTHEVYETIPYTVTLAEGTEDAGNWTITPKQGLSEGDQVTITYNGTKRVKSVTAVKKAATTPVTAITLNKTETSIKVGSTETLSVTAVAPDNATDKTYTWKTSDETKATVDQDGKVTAVAAGTVTIYAEANDGSGVKGNCTVTVTVTPATITVTINQSDWWGWSRSFTKDGVTVSAGMIDPTDGNLMDGGTFSTTLGNFTKIVVTTTYCNVSGTGWSGGDSSKTWAGTPASTVSFSGDFMGMGQTQTTIVCTIVPKN